MKPLRDARRAVVIGAGIAGLATAALLARDGHDVTVLEARETVGGRAGSWEREGFRFDTGPSWYLMPEVFDHFYRMLGTSSAEQLTLSRLDPGYRVFFQGFEDPLDIAADRVANEAIFESVEAGAGPALARYLDSAGDTYRMALRHFLYTNFVSARSFVSADVVKRLGKLARLLLQPLDRFAARFVSDHRLRQVLGYPAVFLGSAPSLAPSMYHLMSHLDLEDGVLYPQGGFAAVIESIRRLAEGEGARVLTSSRVTRILTDEARHPRVTGVGYTDANGITRTLAADVVVSAADLHHTETVLLPEEHRTYPQEWWDKRTAGPGAVLVMLGVRGELPTLIHHNLFFTRNWDENFGRIFGELRSVPEPASVYVCMPSATDTGVAPVGDSNLFLLIPVPADPSIGSGGVDGAGDPAVERAADAAIAQLADWAHLPDLADRIVVRRTVGPADFARDFASWSGSALGPAHTLRQSAFLRGRNVSAKVGGLYFAGGTTVPGVGLPMCLISAELVLKRLRGDVGGAPLPEPLRTRFSERSAPTVPVGERR